jgi:hypothetical protein
MLLSSEEVFFAVHIIAPLLPLHQKNSCSTQLSALVVALFFVLGKC